LNSKFVNGQPAANLVGSMPHALNLLPPSRNFSYVWVSFMQPVDGLQLWISQTSKASL